MLPTDWIFIWQQLSTLLSELPADSPTALKAALNESLTLFESQLLDRDLSDLPVPIAGRMRSYVTESHRLLRLLLTDAMFIAAARNPTSREQRRQAYRERLNLLLQYCQAAITVES
jgi:hypothetical protein